MFCGFFYAAKYYFQNWKIMLICNKNIEKENYMSIFKNLIKHFSNAPQASVNNTPPIPHDDPKPKTENHKVAGVKYYIDNIISFAKTNPDYALNKNEFIKREISKPIYQYTFCSGKTELIHEPTNPYNTNAIKVIIAGKHVGYIKDGSCKHVLNLINENRIGEITSEIYGGKYKSLGCSDEGNLILENGETEYKIRVTIIVQ